MGGHNKLARLPMCLVALAGVWGVAAMAAQPAADWRLRVSAKLLSVYDGTDSASLDAHFNEKGWVQADVRYECSRAPPTKALAAAGLSVSSSVKLASLCVVEGWVAPELLADVASISGVRRVQIPSYVV